VNAALPPAQRRSKKTPKQSFANLFPRIFSVNAFGKARGSNEGRVTPGFIGGIPRATNLLTTAISLE
jgi:hypothetical protein